jgi:hypothetical protein
VEEEQDPGEDRGSPEPARQDAAGQGASLRELMERMGHSSARAALIYQHATQERDEAIAAGMGKLLRRARRKAGADGGAGTELPSGTQRARGRKRAS